MNLQAWVKAHRPGNEMLWRGSAEAQLAFVRDRVVPLIGTGLDWERQGAIVEVISTHRSKSIDLPVYDFVRLDLDLRLVLRDNFDNWKLSVISGEPILANFAGLFHTSPPPEPDYSGDELADVYFEGFPRDKIYGYYDASDGRKWSAQILGDETLWTTLFLLLRSIGAIKPVPWGTRKKT